MSGATDPQFVRRLFFRYGCVAAAGLLTILTMSPAEAGPIAWHKDLQAAMRESARQQKPMLVSVARGGVGRAAGCTPRRFPTQPSPRR